MSLSILDILDPSNDPNRGIDLSKRGPEVAKLFYAGFARQVFSYGYEVEDVLQEVYAGILTRNNGKGAYNPKKASFSHYVYMVARCVISNYHRKQKKLNRGVAKTPVLDDASNNSLLENSIEASVEPIHVDVFEDLCNHVKDLVQKSKNNTDAQIALKALPYVKQGFGRSEIAKKLDISDPVASRALAYLRQVTKEWVQGL